MQARRACAGRWLLLLPPGAAATGSRLPGERDAVNHAVRHATTADESGGPVTLDMRGLVLFGRDGHGASMAAAAWLHERGVSVRLVTVDEPAVRRWLQQCGSPGQRPIPQFFWNGRWFPNGFAQVQSYVEAGRIFSQPAPVLNYRTDYGPGTGRLSQSPVDRMTIYGGALASGGLAYSLWQQRQAARRASPPPATPSPPKSTPAKRRRIDHAYVIPDFTGSGSEAQYRGEAIVEALPSHVRRAIQVAYTDSYPDGAEELAVEILTRRGQPSYALIEREDWRSALRVVLAGRPHVGAAECRRILERLGYQVSSATAAKDRSDTLLALTGKRPPPGATAPKLTDAQVRAIAADQRPANVLAREYSVSAATIYRVRTGVTYKRVAGEAT